MAGTAVSSDDGWSARTQRGDDGLGEPVDRFVLVAGVVGVAAGEVPGHGDHPGESEPGQVGHGRGRGRPQRGGGGGEPGGIATGGIQRGVHFMRNALAHAGKTQRRMVSAAIGTVFVQDTPEAAKTQWRSVADQLRAKFPKLSALMDMDLYPAMKQKR